MPTRIVIVDHDADRQRTLAAALRRGGHETVAAHSASEAFDRWSAERPDVMLVEADLPEVDGFALATRIRAQETPGTHLPILLLTDVGDTEHKVRALRAGADDLQVRPIHAAELSARIRSLLARYAPREAPKQATTEGQVHAYYGAKGGVGTTTLAINAAIALHRGMRRKVVLLDANLQFGDHRVFLDLGLDRRSIVDVVTSSSIDEDIIRSIVVHHDSGIDLLLAPPSPESAELVSSEQHHLAQVIAALRRMYDYVVVDVDSQLDDTSLDVVGAADALFVVMTADLSCLKNVRLVLETMKQLDASVDKVQLVLNRSNAFTGINVKTAESALRRRIDFQILNDYRTAISAMNSGSPFNAARSESPLSRAVLEMMRTVDRAEHPAQAVPRLVPLRA